MRGQVQVFVGERFAGAGSVAWRRMSRTRNLSDNQSEQVLFAPKRVPAASGMLASKRRLRLLVFPRQAGLLLVIVATRPGEGRQLESLYH